MKFWRTTSVVALAVAFSASTAFAALAPKAPAAATGALSCGKTVNKTLVDGFAMCPERNNTTSTGVGNGFPWENSTFFFANYRNQYFWPSSTVQATSAISCTIESIHARDVSFTGASTNNYGLFLNGDPSTLVVTDSVATSIVATFALNTGPNTYCSVSSTDAGGQLSISLQPGPRGAERSTCTTCPMGDMWCSIGDITAFPAGTGLLLDTTLNVGTGNSGAGVWDTGASGVSACSGPRRAFGSGSFVNTQHMTTAYGVDNFDMVWVFKGTAPPPPGNVQQQISEIIRLLLTPQGLRCSFLDTDINDRLDDNAVHFPDGKKWDSISPQVTSGGEITGEEVADGRRGSGWLP